MGDQGPVTHLVMTVITVAGVAVIMWMEAPEWQREAIKRAVKLRARRLAARAAHASGHRAMGDELGGRRAEADAGYGFTYRLSRLRDRMTES
jgi:hypothetical protein